MPRESGASSIHRKCSWARLCTTRRSTFTGSPAFAGDDAGEWRMQFWIIQTLNSIAFGGLLFLLSSGFSLAFGLMRIPNLAHGGFFMLGAYLGATVTYYGGNFLIAVLAAGVGVGLVGVVFERLILRPLAGHVGLLGAPALNAYPGLDADMLPLALIVVILGGAGSLLGAFVGSFVVGFLYNFGIALFPDLAYFILFLPMVLVLVFMPQGLFGRVQT